MLRTFQHKHLTWIDLENPTEAEVRAVAEEYRLHPTVAEELMIPTPKPRVELYKDYIYLILHFPAWRHSHRTKSQEVDFVVGHDFIITTHYEVVDPIHKFSKVFEVNSILQQSEIGEHAGFVFFYMVQKLYKGLIHELDYIADALRHMEDKIYTGKEREMVRRLSEVGRELLSFKQSLAPHGDILESFAAAARTLFGTNFEYYSTTIRGQYQRVLNIVENHREGLAELRETNNGLLSTKQNEIIQELTVVASIFLPLALITQIFGMSTTNIPLLDRPDGFWVVISLLATVGIITYAFFKYRKFL